MIAVGIDVGSTWIKALALEVDDPAGAPLAAARLATPWHPVAGGGTETTGPELLAVVEALLGRVAEVLGGRRVAAIGVTGMAEAGVLLGGGDVPVAPVVAWFDPRGGAEFLDAPPALREAFPGVTGLPVGPLATVAKLLHRRAAGLSLAGLTWLDVPEFVVHGLGGERCGEVSLVARTGLLDQDTATPWIPALEAVGADASLLSPLRAAGSSWGQAERVPASMRGAVLTVAGHDDLVASVAAGVVGPHQLYDSLGTAEALVRVLDRPVPRERRGDLAAHNVNTVRHLLPGRFALLAGTRSGLVLRRVLSLVGAADDAGRDRLDVEVLALADGPDPAVRVTGALNTVSTLGVEVDADDVTPARLAAAAIAHGTDVLLDVVARMDAAVGPASETVLSGGWSRMASVRRARTRVLPAVSLSALADDTAHGAARIGAFAVYPVDDDLGEHLGAFAAGPATRSDSP